MSKLQLYKKQLGYGILIVIVGSLLLVVNKVINHGFYFLNAIWESIVTFLNVIKPIIYAFIIAYLLYTPVVFIEKLFYKIFNKKELSQTKKMLLRILSIILVFVIVILLFMTIIHYMIPPFIENIKILLNSLPEFEEQITVWIKEFTVYLDTLNIDYTSDGQLMMQFKEIVTNIGESILNGITVFIGGLSGVIVDAVVTIILTFYFLKDKEKLFVAIDKFGTVICSPRIKHSIKSFLHDLDDIVGKFLVGTVLASLVVGFISTILMIIIKHPFAVLIGVAAGLTNVIPYVGPIIGAGLAFILGSFTSLKMGILGAVLLLLYQQVDGNLIQPKIVGDKVGVAPVWILIGVLIGGSYFGGLGMILAIPVTGLIAVYINRLYRRKVE